MVELKCGDWLIGRKRKEKKTLINYFNRIELAKEGGRPRVKCLFKGGGPHKTVDEVTVGFIGSVKGSQPWPQSECSLSEALKEKQGRSPGRRLWLNQQGLRVVAVKGSAGRGNNKWLTIDVHFGQMQGSLSKRLIWRGGLQCCRGLVDMGKFNQPEGE